MAVLKACTVLIFVSPVLCLLCQEGKVRNSDIIRNHTLNGNLVPHRTVFSIPGVHSWMHCVRLCLLRSVCKSLVYDHISGDCAGYVVKQDSANYQLTYAAEKSYIEVTNLPQSIAGSCSDHECGFHEICVPDGFTGHHCTVVGRCSSAPVSETQVVYFIPNKEITYWCPNPDSSSAEQEHTSRCFGDDQWTPTINC